MAQFCQNQIDCRRTVIANHFGEGALYKNYSDEGNIQCDNCQAAIK